MYEAIDVQDQRHTLVFVIPHPPLILLPPRLNFSVVWSTVCFLFIGVSLVALFFSCIAERARDIVGQPLEIRNEVKP